MPVPQPYPVPQPIPVPQPVYQQQQPYYGGMSVMNSFNNPLSPMPGMFGGHGF